MDAQFQDLLQQAGRVLVTATVPTLAVPVIAFLFAIVQGMLAIQEQSMQYALKVVTFVIVLTAMSATVAASCTDLMRFALR